MANSACRKKVRTLLTIAGVLAATAIILYATGIAAQEKSIPDHSNFNDCRPCHAEIYKIWEISRHNTTLARVVSDPGANADCFGCHTAEGFAAKLQGNKVDPAKKESFHSISCVTCHTPGSNTNPRMLVMNSEKLCDECHAGRQRVMLQGKGFVRGIEAAQSVHSAITCVGCHMNEANHGMKLFRPDNPELPEDRLDTCTLCHKDNNRKERARQLTDWQSLYNEALKPVETDMAAIEARLKEKPGQLNADMEVKLRTLRLNLMFLRRDGSRGAHNLDYARAILAQAAKDINEIKEAIK